MSEPTEVSKESVPGFVVRASRVRNKCGEPAYLVTFTATLEEAVRILAKWPEETKRQRMLAELILEFHRHFQNPPEYIPFEEKVSHGTEAREERQDGGAEHSNPAP